MSRKVFFVLLFVAFIDAMGVGLVYPLFSSMIFNPQWNVLPIDASDSVRGFWLGILISVSPLVQTLLSPFIGSLSDRIGRRPLILGTISCGVFSYLFAAFGVTMQSLSILLVARVVFGMAASNYSAANASVADVSSSSEKADRFAKMSMAFGAGFAVGPLLGGILAGDGVFLSENFVRPFLVSGLLSFLNAVAVYLWLPETLSASLSLKQSQVHPLKAIIRDILDIDSSSI
jgi:DHA1 family tetracycline resistance protein-like MFS transporter